MVYQLSQKTKYILITKKGIQKRTNKPIIIEIVLATCSSRDKFRSWLDGLINFRAVLNIITYETIMTTKGMINAAIRTTIVNALRVGRANFKVQITIPTTQVQAIIMKTGLLVKLKCSVGYFTAYKRSKLMAVKLSIDVVPNAISNNKKNSNDGPVPFDKPEKKRKQNYYTKFSLNFLFHFSIYDLVF